MLFLNISIHTSPKLNFFSILVWRRYIKKDEAVEKTERGKEEDEKNRKGGHSTQGVPSAVEAMTLVPSHPTRVITGRKGTTLSNDTCPFPPHPGNNQEEGWSFSLLKRTP